MLKNHVRPALGELALISITRGQVKDLLAQKRAGGLAKDSVRLIRATISAIYADAQDAELVTTNSARILRERTGCPQTVRSKLGGGHVSSAVVLVILVGF